MKYRSVTISLVASITLMIGEIGAQTDYSALTYRNVGPTRGGRVTAVAGTASSPSTFYMGATGGGVWKTDDYGITWINVSDATFTSPSIGAMRVAESDPNVLYVGTGSDGLRSNVISGDGVYKSVDGGQNWKHIGLRETGHIGAVEIHPNNHNIAFVAAIGQAFQPNTERGIFRTKDGGESWDKVLYLNDTVGFSDFEFLPGNPEIMYAAAWRAERKPWTIISGGYVGGIYKSTDGGDNWTQLKNGLPDGLIGKIDLAVCPGNSRLLYALVEAPEGQGGLYMSSDQGEHFELVSTEYRLLDRPFYYCNVDVDPTNCEVVYVNSTRFHKSTDGGKTWVTKSTPHGDNHDMWFNPDIQGLFIQANDGGANVTLNNGESWSTQYNQPTAELYQVEVDDQYPYWLYAGQQDNYTTVSVPSLPPYGMQAGALGFVMNTGGCETGPAVPKPGDPNIVYANCKGRFTVFNKSTGQEKRYEVGAANMYGHDPKDLMFRFQRVSPIHISPHDPNIIYHCSQFVHKTTDEGETWQIISPDLTAFTPETQGISGEPITRDITGEEFYSTIYSIRESSRQPGTIWVGANDGPVHVTTDAGDSWQNVTPEELPAGGRVDCVEPSPHQDNKAYIAVLRYQLGDWKPYIFRTNDMGKSWKLITSGLPERCPTRVVREDPRVEGVLYAGTDLGVFISTDDGENWQPFQQNLPVTPITDMKIHRGDLVMSTMGRSFWILDQVPAEALQSGMATNQLILPEETIRYRYSNFRSGVVAGPSYPSPGLNIDYNLTEAANLLRMTIKNDNGDIIRSYASDVDTVNHAEWYSDMGMNLDLLIESKELETSAGLHRFRWDLRHYGPWHASKNRRYNSGPMVSPGKYIVELRIDDQVISKTVSITPDPRIEKAGVTIADLEDQVEFALQVRDLLSEARKLLDQWGDGKADPKKMEILETNSGRYPQPKLVDQISYLYSNSTRADQRIGVDAKNRLDALRKKLDELNAK